ncbi:hypothetical protein LCGC14_1245270 [marine sediment metagenome]|uniref:HNH nuclease domain-containing protein n=1 Tax=marine sediment metagenome TaxID=412755 RepID=A0A0F9L4M4_9ZZZZ
MRDKLGRFIKGEHNSINTEFKKEFTPWNKGIKTGIIPKTAFKKGQVGKKAGHWKGGKFTSSNGYVMIYEPKHPFCKKNGQVYEHRLVMDKHLGRYLTSEEVVHHINNIKSDNRIENLMLFNTKKSHTKFHHIQEGIKSGEIIFDGKKL